MQSATTSDAGPVRVTDARVREVILELIWSTTHTERMRGRLGILERFDSAMRWSR